MQITTTTRYRHTPTNTANMKDAHDTSAGEERGHGDSNILLAHVEWGGHWRKLLVNSNKDKHALTTSASNPLVGIYSKERKRPYI